MPPVALQELVSSFITAAREAVREDPDPDPSGIVPFIEKLLEAAKDGLASEEPT